MKYPNDKPTTPPNAVPTSVRTTLRFFLARGIPGSTNGAAGIVTASGSLKTGSLVSSNSSANDSSVGIDSKSTSSNSNSVSAAGPNDMFGSISTVAPFAGISGTLGSSNDGPGTSSISSRLARRQQIG